MNALKAGFARIDITPPLGVLLQGYSYERHAVGVLDPLLATAVCFDDGCKRIVVVSIDLIGCSQCIMKDLRPLVAEAIQTETEGVFLHCTHTHLGAGIASPDNVIWPGNEEYVAWFMKRIRDVAVLAVQDLAPASLSYTRGKVKDVAFIRRYQMKDGSFRTNPGFQNPEIDHALGTPDENSSLLIIKRENAPEIGIVNFQVHPDVIGGRTISADYPKFVRDTYETLIPNSRCMYINGAQGDTNHIDIRLSEDKCRRGYDRSRYMGRKIAMSVVANYELAEPLEGEKIAFGQKSYFAAVNKGTAEELEASKAVMKVYESEGLDAITPFPGRTKAETRTIAKRVVGVDVFPNEKELYLTAVSVGDVVFAGFPGEPFTDIGRGVKANSKFTLTVPACAANGYEGYFPMMSAFREGGYEALNARYVGGTAEKLIEISTEVINGL